MYFLVSLKESVQKVVVPQKWIKNLDLESILNYGIKCVKKKMYKVYHSNNFDDEPDFHLNVSNLFNKNRPACYEALLINVFGKIKHC